MREEAVRVKIKKKGKMNERNKRNYEMIKKKDISR